MAHNEVTIDFTNIQDDIVVDEDIYTVLIKSFKLKKAQDGQIKPNSEGKYPYFQVRAEIVEGPFAGKQLFTNLTTDPTQASNGNAKNYMLFNFLKALEFVAEKGTVTIPDENEIVNKEMGWEVKIVNDQNDNPRNEVKKFHAAI